MISLVMDTCTERGILAFIESKEGKFKLLHLSELPPGIHSSRYLLPKLEESFSVIGIRPQELGRIVAAVGPGSYTGIRAGVVVAKTLSFACHIPLVGVLSLEGYIPLEDGLFATMLDAKMAGCYFLVGKREKDKIVYLEKPQAGSLKEAEGALKGIKSVVSPDCGILQDKFKEIGVGDVWKWAEGRIDPLYLAKLGEERFLKGDYSEDGSLEIVYLR